MRPKSDQFPSDYSDFKKKYLTEKGIIKQPNDFLGKVSGYISYLNRETDIRQFAHPVLKTIPVPISESTGKEIKEKLVKLEEELDHAEETFAKNEELKKKGKERMKGEKKELTDKCKEIKNREQKKKCKEDLAKRSQEFKEYLFTDTDKILKNAKEKMKGLKKDIQKTRNELKNYRETDPSQERMLLEKCFKQESDK
jgi:hypothetical protein